MNAQGTLFGTTNGGGETPCYCGTVFELQPPAKMGSAWTFSALHSFAGGKDGAYAGQKLALAGDGSLFSVTTSQGDPNCTSRCGTVFELAPPAAGQTSWTETVLHRFTGGADGGQPRGSLLLLPSGVLYGTTGYAGSFGAGTIFRLTPPGTGKTIWKETVLYSFKGTTDGYDPNGAMARDKTGNLYGITENGGQGIGVIFQLTPPASGQKTWTETPLYSFSGGTGGEYPAGGVLLSNSGSLFGVVGDAADTAVWELTPPSGGTGPWTEKYAYTYVGSSASVPLSVGGTLYLASSQGGISCSANPSYGCGFIFSIAR